MITVKLSTRFTCLVHNNRIRKIDVACKSWEIARFIIVHKERERERDYSNRFTIAAHVTAIVGTSLLVVHRKRARGDNSTNNIDRVRFFSPPISRQSSPAFDLNGSILEAKGIPLGQFARARWSVFVHRTFRQTRVPTFPVV